jgi:hypothetical protein
MLSTELSKWCLPQALSLAAQFQDDPDNLAICKTCCGLLLFGVPNLGLKHDQLLSMVRGQPNERLVKDLVVDRDAEPSPFLASLSRRFADCCQSQDIHIVSFYERRESSTVMV